MPEVKKRLKLKLVIPQFILLMLFRVDVQGQDSLEKLKNRARSFEPIIVAAATRYGVDANLLWTIAYLESRFDPKAVSYKDGRPCAFGLMQFVPETAQQYGLTNPHNPRDAVDAGARYVRDLLKRFDGRGDLVLAAYNAGAGTVEAYRDGRSLVLQNGKVINPKGIRTGGIPPYAETRAYVARGTLIYQNIARKNLTSVSVRSKLTARGIDDQDDYIETSIYTSAFDLSDQPIGLSKGFEKKESARTLSLYAN